MASSSSQSSSVYITEVREAVAGYIKAQRAVAGLAWETEADAACTQALQLPDGQKDIDAAPGGPLDLDHQFAPSGLQHLQCHGRHPAASPALLAAMQLTQEDAHIEEALCPLVSWQMTAWHCMTVCNRVALLQLDADMRS